MKQHITIQDLAQLSDKAKERLREWWKPEVGDSFYNHVMGEVFYGELSSGTEAESYEPDKVYFGDDWKKHGAKDLPLLSIGQMFEFLNIATIQAVIEPKEGYYINGYFREEKELCDALFQAVKELLEQGNE